MRQEVFLEAHGRMFCEVSVFMQLVPRKTLQFFANAAETHAYVRGDVVRPHREKAMAKDLLAAAAHAREGFSVIVVGSAHVEWELDGHMDPGSTFDVDLFYTIAHPALDS